MDLELKLIANSGDASNDFLAFLRKKELDRSVLMKRMLRRINELSHIAL